MNKAMAANAELLTVEGVVQTWTDSWRSIGAHAPAGLLDELLTAWRETHRRYHDERHLAECMTLWSRWQEGCEHPGEVGVALWFHDAVYDPMSSANELRSAAWAARSLLGAGLSSEVAQRVHDLVMATQHAAPAATATPDTALLVDIDLSILGSPPERFEAYDQDVRKEYAWVPGFVYSGRRAKVLQGFLDRPQIYQTAAAAQLLERQARLNLTAALTRLAQ